MRRNIAVILAAGKGSRLDYGIPKQLVKLAGKPLIEHTLEIFEKNEAIHELAVVTNDICLDAIERIVTVGKFSKVKKILLGGEARYQSSLSAIRAYEEEARNVPTNLIFHDAVRPLVSSAIVDRVINALEHHKAVDVAVRTTDTIVVVEPSTNTIVSIPPRGSLRNGQTPQGFEYDTIRRAYDMALTDPNFSATDDCGVVLRYAPEVPIYVVEGELENIKLTHAQDLFLLDKLFQLRVVDASSVSQKEPPAFPELQGKVMVVFGGTSGIGREMVNVARECGAKCYAFSRRTGQKVQSPSSVRACLSSVFEKEGVIDFVVNTAAVLRKQALSNLSYEDIEESIDTNYLGAIVVAKESFDYLERSRGHLLLFTSSSYTLGRPHYSIYSSSKAAIVNLTQALSEEWSHANVRVNCMSPERTKTPMRVSTFGLEPDETLLGAQDVARAALRVLTKTYTGQVIAIRKKQ